MLQIKNLFPNWDELEKPAQTVRVVGIDLGTTNSAVAEFLLEPGKEPQLRCVEIDQATREGNYTNYILPSVVALFEGKEYVGEGAKRLRARAPDFGLVDEKNIFWECKNHMGIKKTYNKAPAGYRSAKDISGRLVNFMLAAVRDDDDQNFISETVVTVPASFQAPQRNDTILAAQAAGAELLGGDLLDEPVAAFLAWLYLHGDSGLLEKEAPTNILVFDFGGGTCDVAIFTLAGLGDDSGLKVAPRSVSRYHRLGGGDLDRAILFEVLIKKVIKENGLAEHDLTYEDKVRSLLPAFLGVAEALKIGLCKEIFLKRNFGKLTESEVDAMVKTLPGIHKCTLPTGKILELNSPALTGRELRECLEPFLDHDILVHHETEYRMTNSIFSPLMDALGRARMKKQDINCCLLVGGSTLIPQVIDAVEGWFPSARVLSFDNLDDSQLAVAKGAACQALYRELTGRNFVTPVIPEDVFINTTSTPVKLIPAGAPLPYPSAESWGELHDLAIPKTSTDKPIPLLLFLMNAQEVSFGMLTWHLPPPVKKGQGLRLEYRIDENQVFKFRLSLKDDAGKSRFSGGIENSLNNVVNPNSKREKIFELEENVRTGGLSREDVLKKTYDIALLYYELGQNEKALDIFRRLLNAKGEPDANILNYMGIIANELGNDELAEKCYVRAGSIGNISAPLFNLAQMQEKKKEYQKASETLKKAISVRPDPMYYALMAKIENRLGNTQKYNEYLKECLDNATNIDDMNSWELSQLSMAADLSGDKGLLSNIQYAQDSKDIGIDSFEEGYFPDRRT